MSDAATPPALVAGDELFAWLGTVCADDRAEADLKGEPIPCHIQILWHPDMGWGATIVYADGSGHTGEGGDLGLVVPS